jgi:hypothetical protein
MSQVTTIEEQVIAATGLKPKEGENRQKWLGRLATAADTRLSEEEWAELPDEAQTWINSAVTAKNEKTPLPDPNGESAPDADDDDDAGDEAPVKAKASKKAPAAEAAADDDDDAEGGELREDDDEPAAEAKPGKAPKAKKEKKADAEPKVKKPRAAKGSGNSDFLRRFICKNPESTTKEQDAALAEAKIELSSGSKGVVRYEVRKVLAILAELGKLKK